MEKAFMNSPRENPNSFTNCMQDHWEGQNYSKNSVSQKASADDFITRAGFHGINSILDVGCGDGKITAEMARSIPHGFVMGIDISPSMIEAANRSFPDQKNLIFRNQDASALNLDLKFDLVTSFTVLHWVLEQSQALKCFAKVLNPEGKLWIQMPAGLSKVLQQSLNETIANNRWKKFFVDFSPPWRFFQIDEYDAFLLNANFIPNRIDVSLKDESFPSRMVFHNFLQQWLPHLRPLSNLLKPIFLSEVLDKYLSILPADKEGKVSFSIDRLEVEATLKKHF